MELLDDPDLLITNRRAAEQRGRFLIRLDAEKPLEAVLGNALTRFNVPADGCDLLLRRFDQMNLNASRLMADPDAVAHTVMMRQGAI